MNKSEFLKALADKDVRYETLAKSYIDNLELELDIDLVNVDYQTLLGFFNVIDATVQSKHLGFMEILKNGGVDGVLTDTVYENYLQYMEDIGGAVMSKTKFSQMLGKHYNYTTKLQHIPALGKTQRVYIFLGNEE